MRPITTNGTDGKIPVPDHSRGEAWKYEAQEDVCSFCQSIGECPLGTGGWQFMLDKQASEEKGYPDFRLRRCDRWLAADSQERAEKMLGARFAERTFETFEVKKENAEAFEKCKAYADRLNHDTERGLLIVGPVGTGKTHLAAAIIKKAFDKMIPAAMISAPELLREIQKGFEDAESRYLAEKVKSKTFLVLDDLGAEMTTDWTVKEFYMLLDDRYKRKLPTVITTNCLPDELEKAVGARVADRLRETSEIVKIGGKSWRKFKGEEYIENQTS